MTSTILIKMTDLDLSGQRVLIREDLNVPIDDGEVLSDQRIVAALPTIQSALSAGAQVQILSHLGRPEEGVFSEIYSLKPVARYLSGLLGREVRLAKDWLDGITMSDGDVVVCENVRFNVGELDKVRLDLHHLESDLLLQYLQQRLYWIQHLKILHHVNLDLHLHLLISYLRKLYFVLQHLYLLHKLEGLYLYELVLSCKYLFTN